MNPYGYALSITSQFYYCSLPLRLDTYSRCQFNCAYCFANARGGNRDDRAIMIADLAQLQRQFEASRTAKPKSAIVELLEARQPIHFGGMSDPFMPLEERQHQSLDILRMLADYKYPTVISTKSTLPSEDRYLSVLKTGRFIVQVSLSTLDENLSSRIELGTPGPRQLLRMVRTLSREGIPVAIRAQPLLPCRDSDGEEIIKAAAECGARHIAFEHLKLPLERNWNGTEILSRALGFDMRQAYANWGATRVGREWILPVRLRTPTMLKLRANAHSAGLTFGAADNDLLLLSDGRCCCSGIDLLDDGVKFFRYTYLEAARTGLKERYISIQALNSIWRPNASIGRYVNSRSRRAASHLGTNIEAYIKGNWNGRTNGNSPAALFGVRSSGLSDADGFNLYELTDEIRPHIQPDER